MAKTLDVARSEIRDRLQRWDEIDITLLFGINFGRMWTRWKGKFVHFTMEQCFSICFFWKLNEKFVKMRQQWYNEELKEATTMRSKDWDHDLVQEEVEGN